MFEKFLDTTSKWRVTATLSSWRYAMMVDEAEIMMAPMIQISFE